MALTRRKFLSVLGLGTVGAVVFAGCSVPERKWVIESPARLPEDLVTGTDNWYATVHPETGEGIIVRVMEGRAKKVEGNPDYPVNRGKSSARAQTAVQALYHPDRIQYPLTRSDRHLPFSPTTWDDGLNALASRLSERRGSPDSVIIITEPLRGHVGLIVERFAQAYGATHIALEPLEETALRAATKKLFGQDIKPWFDIAHANYVISFGADFLNTWSSPVQYGIAYGQFRQGVGRTRGHLVQVEPRFSLTAANADQWVPIKPGAEGALALSMAYVIISEGLGDRSAADMLTDGKGAAALEVFRPEEAAIATGVQADTIRELARGFAQSPAAVAMGGGLAGASTNGAANLTAILALNLLANNVGKTGGVQFSAAPPIKDLPSAERVTPLKDWEAAIKRMQEQKIGLVLVHGADPLHGLPAYSGFAAGLDRVPYVASFSSFTDDTTAQADLVLPDHASLEAWGDDVPNPGAGLTVSPMPSAFATWGVQQPVVRPLYDTFSFADSLLTLAKDLGGKVRDALPWNNLREAIQDGARQLQQTGRGSVQAGSFDAFWNAVLQRGGWWDDSARADVKVQPVKLPVDLKRPTFAGPESEYPYHLVVFPTNIGDGRNAHLPWLQALGDPVSSIAWQTWVELNPDTAAALGAGEGDIVEVESLYGKLEGPVYLNPAAAPDVVSIPVGQGHSDYGRYAEKRGANVMSILAPLTDNDTGGLAWAATRVRLRRTGAHVRLVKYEGNVQPIQDEEHPIVQTTGPV